MTFLRSLIFYLFVVLCHSQASKIIKNDPIVDTLTGKVRGSLVRSDLTGEDYLAFTGIPYAKPPIGHLRFEDPLPAEPWSGIRDAKNYGPACQHDIFNKTEVGDDCLHVNVFVRGTKIPSQKRPVMVWIYGGNWHIGNGDDMVYGPDYFMRKDIVFVTFNYRAGIFGFLNLEDEIAPGNQGLQDQVLLLKWIKANIAKFGGDPDNVTIFGEDAGGISVHFLALSPATKGLFHKAIIQSGNIYHPVIIDVVDPKNFTYQMINLLNKNTKNHTEIKEILKKTDFAKLSKYQLRLHVKEDDLLGMVAYSVSVDSKAKNPIVPIKFHKLALQGVHVPLMIGYNSNEALIHFHEIGYNYEKWNKYFEKYLPATYIYYIKKRYNITVNDLKPLYFDGGKITEKNRINLTNFLTDVFFVEGTHKTLKIQVEKSKTPTYFYVYSYDKTQSALKGLININEPGAIHTDELDHLFRRKFFENKFGVPALKKGSKPYKLMEQMIEMWVNFATTGNPTPTTSELIPTKWLPVNDTSNLLYMNIGDNLRMEKMSSMVDLFKSLSPKQKA